ncbi:MAG: hypothetical protein WC325_13210 [Candidatus Bathyarchaeia archaeon]|jgi:hypothetical protein
MLSLDTRISKLETEYLREGFNIDNLTITEFLNLDYFFDKTQVANIRDQLNAMTNDEKVARAERFKQRTGRYPCWKLQSDLANIKAVIEGNDAVQI